MAFALSQMFTEAFVVDTWTSRSRGIPPSSSRRLGSSTAHSSASLQSEFRVRVPLCFNQLPSWELWKVGVGQIPPVTVLVDRQVLQGDSVSAQFHVSVSGGPFGRENSFGVMLTKQGHALQTKSPSSSPSRDLIGNFSAFFVRLQFFPSLRRCSCPAAVPAEPPVHSGVSRTDPTLTRKPRILRNRPGSGKPDGWSP